jgi:hypothetical protein
MAAVAAGAQYEVEVVYIFNSDATKMAKRSGEKITVTTMGSKDSVRVVVGIYCGGDGADRLQAAHAEDPGNHNFLAGRHFMVQNLCR